MIAKCPKCSEEVQLPHGLAAASKVRCPLCREEYSLGEALEKLPPALIVLEAVSAVPATAQGAGFSASDADSLSPEADLGDLTLADTADAVQPTFAPRTGEGRTTAGVRPGTRPKRPPANPVAEGVKVVLGGAVGLFLAQMLLWWLPGEWRRDPLNLAPKLAQYPAARILLPKSFWPVDAEPAGQESVGGNEQAGNEEPMKSVPSGAGLLDGSKTDWNKVIKGQGDEPPGDSELPAKKPTKPKSPDDDLKLESLDEPAVKKPEKAPDLGLDDLNEPKPAAPKSAEPKVTDPKPAEPKPAEPKADPSKPDEPKADAPKADAPPADEPKA